MSTPTQKTPPQQSKPQTTFLSLPAELRQTILDITHSDEVTKAERYEKFLELMANAHRSHFSYDYIRGCILPRDVQPWVEGMKKISGQTSEDMEYVVNQWKKKYLALNSEYSQRYRTKLESLW